MIFVDRVDAGLKLAKKLDAYARQNDVLVLAIPRGGVPVAFQVACELSAPLDVFVVRKLGVPSREELAFGAIATGGIRILDEQIVESMGISDMQIERITAKEKDELDRRERVYRGNRPFPNLENKTVILVDDGIATGASTRAAISALRQLKPARIVLAVPVAPAATCESLQREVDDLICVFMPQFFFSIGQFYDDFSQVSDQEVMNLLQFSANQRAQEIPANRQYISKGVHS
jgi:putative phosphoribosyl transferase